MKRLAGVLLLVLAIAGLVNVVRKFADDTPKQSSGSSSYDKGQRFGRYSAPGVLVMMGLLGLRLLFQSDDARPASPPPRRNPAGNRPPPGHPSLRGGQDTFASNPALVRLRAGQWLAANPAVIIITSSLAVVGFVVLFIKPLAGAAILITAGIVLYRAIQESRQKFYMGDVCPGVVLSAQANLVAIMTDLKAAAPTPRPAIKILKQPLARMTTETAYDGMRVAAVALYHGNVTQPAWRDFSPEVIHCVERNPDEIARVLGSIPEEEWQALDQHLAQVPVAKPGLYRLWGANAAAPTATEINFAPPRPWFKTAPGIIGLSLLGVIVGLMLMTSLLGTLLRRAQNRPAPPQHGPAYATPAPSAGPAHLPPQPTRPQPITQLGPYAVGSRVSARWASKWVPGTITAINPGGFTMMIKLDDARFPFPVGLPTNQFRLN